MLSGIIEAFLWVVGGGEPLARGAQAGVGAQAGEDKE